VRGVRGLLVHEVGVVARAPVSDLDVLRAVDEEQARWSLGAMPGAVGRRVGRSDSWVSAKLLELQRRRLVWGAGGRGGHGRKTYQLTVAGEQMLRGRT
jgi:hypothetical protein